MTVCISIGLKIDRKIDVHFFNSKMISVGEK